MLLDESTLGYDHSQDSRELANYDPSWATEWEERLMVHVVKGGNADRMELLGTQRQPKSQLSHFPFKVCT